MNKLFLQILMVFLGFITTRNNGNCQWEKLKGKWIDSSQRFIQISDTTDRLNSLSNENNYDESFYLSCANDTLYFYSRYTTSANRVEHRDYYNFKIVNVTDSFLTIIPVSKFSKNAFSSSSPQRFTRKEYFVDTGLVFEKIIFQTGECGGKCVGLAIQIDNTRKILYHRDFRQGMFDVNRPKDSLAGNFEGTLTEKSYNHLLNLIKTSNVRNLKYNKQFCCDGVVTTFIIYTSKGQRTYIKSMFLPDLMNELINFFYHLRESESLQKTEQEFDIEM